MQSHSDSFDSTEDFEDILPGEVQPPKLSLGDYVTLNAFGTACLKEEEEIEGHQLLNTLLRWDGSPVKVIDFDVNSKGELYTVIRLMELDIPVPQIFLSHVWMN